MYKIYILGEIDNWGWMTSNVIDGIKEAERYNDDIVVYINSPGGSVYDGIAIYNILKEHKPEVRIIGQAASIASVIAMSAAPGKLKIADNAVMLVHKPWLFTGGNEDDLEKAIETLKSAKDSIKKAYQSRLKINDDELEDLLKLDRDMSAEECVDKGFADKIYTPGEEEEVEISNQITKLEANKRSYIAAKRKENNFINNSGGSAMPDTSKVELTASQLYAQNDQLKSINDRQSEEIKSLTAKLNDATASAETLKVKVGEYEKEISNLKTESSTKDETIQKLNSTIAEQKIDNILLENSKKIKPADREMLKAKLVALANSDVKVGDKSMYDMEVEAIQAREDIDLEKPLDIDVDGSEPKSAWSNFDDLFNNYSEKYPEKPTAEIEKMVLNKLGGK